MYELYLKREWTIFKVYQSLFFCCCCCCCCCFRRVDFAFCFNI